MEIYLIRHGQTTGDIENRYGGDYDDDLTDRGHQQSSELADLLADKGIKAVYAGPLKRAQQTARHIADRLGLPIVTVDNLRERNFYGVLTGMKKTEALQQYPELVRLLDDYHSTITGAEDYKQFKARFLDALDGVIAENKHHTIAVVTHGGPISMLLREVIKAGEIRVSDCAYAHIAVQDNKMKLIATHGIAQK